MSDWVVILTYELDPSIDQMIGWENELVEVQTGTVHSRVPVSWM